MQYCSMCKKPKRLEMFPLKRNGTRSKTCDKCQEVVARSQSKRRERLGEEAIRAQARKTYERRKANGRREHYELRTRYGITPEQRDQLLEVQEGRCGICEKLLVKPHIDHCHITGRVRGLLCISCNNGLGKFGDNVEGLQKAIKYLQKTSILPLE